MSGLERRAEAWCLSFPQDRKVEMHVFISDPSSLRNLQGFLRRAKCVAEQCRSHVLEVYVPNASNERQARRDLNVYLATWQTDHLGIETYILEHDGSRGNVAPGGFRAGLTKRV